MTLWQWINSGTGLSVRITLGLTILTILAIVDLQKNKSQARRWREYLFLLFCAIAAMLYGIANDQLTSSISWEYFYYGKGLDEVLGPHTPPNPLSLHLHAALVGMQGTWGAGVLIGVAMLLANNPEPGLDPLPFSRLMRQLSWIYLITGCCAIALGIAGYLGWLTPLHPDFPLMLRKNEFRPYRFMAVFGMHLGGYIGGLLGAILSVLQIRRARRTSRPRTDRPITSAPTA